MTTSQLKVLSHNEWEELRPKIAQAYEKNTLKGLVGMLRGKYNANVT
jgi:hypothetical protein